MFQDISINNFRGIKSAEVENFKRINLFFGKNNCGKSSVLESLFVLSGLSNPSMPLKVNWMRNYYSTSEDSLLMEFHNLDATNGMSFFAHDNDSVRKLEISLLRANKSEVEIDSLQEDNTSSSRKNYGLKYEYCVDDKEYVSELMLKDGDNKVNVNNDSQYEEQLFAQYLPSDCARYDLKNAYSKVLENKQEKEVVQILKAIDPKVVDMMLVGDQLMVDVGLPQRLPVNVMGDGIRKLLSIVLSIFQSRDGLILIDEVDNGFHYSVMPQLWKAIFRSASLTNTQVFVTTHNIDSLRGLVSLLNKEEYIPFQSDVAAYKLIKDADDNVKALRYAFANMNYAINQEMEMR